MKVAVFGGAAPKPGDEVYSQAMSLGRLLAQQGHTVMSGGYVGVMEAVSRGASEAGGFVIGITCNQIEQWRKSKANEWVKEEHKFETLRERMYALIDSCDAAIVLPGGVGTLAELAVTWNELIINGQAPRPLILVGLDWQKLISQLFDTFGGFISLKDRDLICIVPDVEAAVDAIHLKPPTGS